MLGGSFAYSCGLSIDTLQTGNTVLNLTKVLMSLVADNFEMKNVLHKKFLPFKNASFGP